MRRFALALLLVGLGLPALAQTPAEVARTAALIESRQNPDGGFSPTKGGPSSLGATSSAIRILKNVGGSVPDIAKCRAYVNSCFDPKTGGFAPEPGGAPGVGITASGLMAVGELGTATDEIVNGAIGYFSKEAKTFEDMRIAVAGLEAVKKTSPDFARWTALVKEGQNPDGTWGAGGEQARATGSRAAALLRMGVALDKKEAVAAALKAAQGPDGGWSPDGSASNLETTYRVMRSLFMMKELPDLSRLRAYLAAHARPDGGYSSKPGAEDDGGTYFVTTVNRWARTMDGEPAVVETVGFQPLFDGKTLEGWEGDTKLWSVEDGKIVGTSPGLEHNDFLATTTDHADFVLKFTFRMSGAMNPNSGVMFRAVRVGGGEMSGYQADIGEGFWGCLYDESRRNKVLVPASERAKASVRPNGWNHYVIRCMGNRVTLTLNGVTSVDYREEDSSIARTGKVAVQIHSGGPMKVEFKDMLIQDLPIPTADDADTAGFHLRTLGDRKYTVFLPAGFDKEKTYPAILFLHGAGERGTDGATPAQAGIGPIIAADPKRFPAIVVFPQARQTWAADSEDMKAALAAWEEVGKRYEVDPSRVYLTGLSMGGAGSWGLAAKRPEMFAAVAPVCGFGDAKWGESLKSVPVWTFLGDDDMPRIVSGTRALVDAVKAAGGSPKLTEYRGVGHNSWDRAYSDPEMIRWMLSQRK